MTDTTKLIAVGLASAIVGAGGALLTTGGSTSTPPAIVAPACFKSNCDGVTRAALEPVGPPDPTGSNCVCWGPQGSERCWATKENCAADIADAGAGP